MKLLIVLLTLAVLALFCAIPAALLMIILGALSHMIGVAGLAIGFGPSLLITFLLAIFL